MSELLTLAGEVYLPFLVANAEALAAGAETLRFEALGKAYEQGVFKYQAKCLGWLREALAQVGGPARDRLEVSLRESGCWEPLTA